MPALLVAPTEEDIDTALTAFLTSIMPDGLPIVLGQVNRVPVPQPADFIVFWPLRRTRLSTNIDESDLSIDPPVNKTAEQRMDAVYQIDVHGPNSTDNAQIITTLFRDPFATDYFDANYPALSPLYADDAKQLPFINDSNQYEDRWVIEAHLQANIVVTVPQQTADTVTVEVISVDATYPP